MLKAFRSSIETAEISEANLSILKVLCCLFGLFGIIQYSGEFCLVRIMMHLSFCLVARMGT